MLTPLLSPSQREGRASDVNFVAASCKAGMSSELRIRWVEKVTRKRGGSATGKVPLGGHSRHLRGTIPIVLSDSEDGPAEGGGTQQT